MKRGISTLILLLLLVGFVSAECSLSITKVNQNPVEANPGETVSVRFKIDGISNSQCGTIQFELKESYPFTVDPESTNPIIIKSGTSSDSDASYYLATYKLRIDDSALDGETEIETEYTILPSTVGKINKFNITVKDTQADFEISVKDYNAATKAITFEILNIEDVDVEALTIEIPKQNNTEIKGANRVIVGNLDSNEYTTADFEGTLNDGEITLTIIYTDSVNVRRQINKTINFNSSYFTDLARDQTSQPWWLYILILVAVGWFVWRKYKKHKLKKKLQHHG
ncbi:hypothetical protein M0R72_04405 [Candidatus Pacearchaeota archaeon]|jgi:hypothetical protein|nr:hypothetical protein [Candidatus Pacearchaeota archaeon]